jgi:hypothetical protein
MEKIPVRRRMVEICDEVCKSLGIDFCTWLLEKYFELVSKRPWSEAGKRNLKVEERVMMNRYKDLLRGAKGNGDAEKFQGGDEGGTLGGLSAF